jgi:hypothetical protein
MNYGIKITKPWSKEMYDHNDMVSEVMKSEIINQIKKNQTNYDKLNELIVLCGGIKYGDGYSIEELFEDCLNEVDNVQNYWLNEEFPYAVSQGLVNDIDLKFIGYDK